MAMVDASVRDLDAVLEKHGGGGKLLLLLFLADKVPSTGRSWCPDCVRAEPVIYREAETAAEKLTLLRIYVGDRTTWRDPAHPLRSDPRFQLRGVPTLIRWENGKAAARLEDHEAHLAHKVKSLLLSS